MILPQSLTYGPYESLCPSRRALPKSLSTRIHMLSQHLSGALPEPLNFLCSLRMTTSHPKIGPYQTPTSPTKTDQLKKRQRKKQTKQKNRDTFHTGVALSQPQPTNENVFTKDSMKLCSYG